jgi:hypothetical protein
MIAMLAATLAFKHAVQTPPSKIITRTDTVTVVKELKEKWAIYRFENLKLEIELPGKPIAEEYEPDEIEDLDGVVVDYNSETEYENVNLWVRDIPAAEDATPKLVFEDFANMIADDYEETEITTEKCEPFLGFETRLWKSRDDDSVDAEDQQRYWRMLAIDGRREYAITVNGHIDNEDVEPMLRRVLASAKKALADKQFSRLTRSPNRSLATSSLDRAAQTWGGSTSQTKAGSPSFRRRTG